MPSRILTTLFVLLLSVSAGAETLVVPVGQQGSEHANIEKPRSGITMDAVVARFGEPKMKTEPVGDPPISSWDYEHFTVYFEKDRVIHSTSKPNQVPR